MIFQQTVNIPFSIKPQKRRTGFPILYFYTFLFFFRGTDSRGADDAASSWDTTRLPHPASGLCRDTPPVTHSGTIFRMQIYTFSLNKGFAAVQIFFSPCFRAKAAGTVKAKIYPWGRPCRQTSASSRGCDTPLTDNTFRLKPPARAVPPNNKIE